MATFSKKTCLQQCETVTLACELLKKDAPLTDEEEVLFAFFHIYHCTGFKCGEFWMGLVELETDEEDKRIREFLRMWDPLWIYAEPNPETLEWDC